MPRALLALGSNLGDRGRLLRSAVEALRAEEQVVVEGVSPVVVTQAVGGPDGQPDFLNGVVRIRTSLPPQGLLELCQRIEAEHDRVRLERWGPRTLDLDIIDYDGIVLDDPALTLPHPRAAGRAFVLAPWAMLEPEAVLAGRRVSELAREAEDLGGLDPRALRLEDLGAETGGGARS
ncbi:2-amino-4-hydroxy-6-hydroxymethyldihydropteridine diphosphokinase [Kocuria palustris]|uniref:2-amino-4-hydroxy-6- hydroxymethyldihydropteridine diphosphokinase n=1 Tax=Kocuria palustris TaxID=71999 RepID=UPI0011A18CFA|nr:2-amino-4-hydroxy-6-hydroxymethyldihydropteridine diphosphokinase [Kocuria palustris]